MMPLPPRVTARADGRWPLLLSCLMVIGASVVTPRHASAATTYQIFPLSSIEAQADVYVTGINNAGNIVGYVVEISGDSHAVIWQDRILELLPELTLDSTLSQAYRINDSGQIVGKARTADGPLHAVLWEGGAIRDLGTVDGAVESFATDVNGDGVVVGSAVFGTSSVAFRWTPEEGFRSYSPGPGRLANGGFNAINDEGLMVGTTYQLLEPFRAAWARPQDTLIADLSPPGRNLGMALALNNAGVIVGYQGTADIPTQAAIFDLDGNWQPLGTMGFDESFAQDVNESGVIVGRALSYGPGGVTSRAFVFGNGEMSDLSKLTVDSDGWILTDAGAINDAGWIVGSGVWKGEIRGYVAIPLPEPTSTLLAQGALWTACLVRGGRYRRRKAGG